MGGTNQLLFEPDEDEFQESMTKVIHGYQETVLHIQNLISDNYFDAFTRFATIVMSV